MSKKMYVGNLAFQSTEDDIQELFSQFGEVKSVNLITDRETGRLLGASIIGAHATDLIHELLLAKDREISMEDLAKLIHAHPTLSEGIMEAARQSQGWAIHV